MTDHNDEPLTPFMREVAEMTIRSLRMQIAFWEKKLGRAGKIAVNPTPEVLSALQKIASAPQTPGSIVRLTHEELEATKNFHRVTVNTPTESYELVHTV